MTGLSETQPSQSQDIQTFHTQIYAYIIQTSPQYKQNTAGVSVNNLTQKDVSVKLCKFLLSRIRGMKNKFMKYTDLMKL